MSTHTEEHDSRSIGYHPFPAIRNLFPLPYSALHNDDSASRTAPTLVNPLLSGWRYVDGGRLALIVVCVRHNLHLYPVPADVDLRFLVAVHPAEHSL